MILAVAVLILSTAFSCFFFQSMCQSVLRHEVERAHHMVVQAARLEFPALCTALEENRWQFSRGWMCSALRCDFLTLSYLLKKTARPGRGRSNEERLLLVYSRFLFLSLTVRHWLRLREKPAALRLAAVLRYLAGLVGERARVVNLHALTLDQGRS